MINVTYEGKVYEVYEGLKVIDFMKNILNIESDQIMACKVHNEVKSLDYEFVNDCTIEFLDYKTSDGNRIYVRGLTFILIKAFEELYPDIRINVNYSLGHSIYCDINETELLNDDIIENVKNRMVEIINKDIPIIKKILSLEKAKEIYEKNHRIDRLGLMENRMKSYVSMYYCEDTFNYFYGVMPISTKYMKYFDLTLYDKGLLLIYPRRYNPTKIEKIKETKKLYETFNEYDRFNKILHIENVSELNNQIRNGNIGDIIRLSEAMHEKKISNIADMIASNKNKKIVLIAGPSAAGKTTFAQRLDIQLRVNGIKTITLSMDNYFVDRINNPKDENGNYDFECLEAIDLELFNEQLIKLSNGEEVELPSFDFTTGTRKYLGNKAKLHENGVLLIEGIHGLNEKLTEAIPRDNKFKIYISALTALNIDDYNRVATTDLRLLRRILRDSKYRGHNAIVTLKMWNSVRHGEEKYIFPFQEEADVMFNSSLIYEISALKTDVEPLLASVNNTVYEYSEAKRIREFLAYFLPIEITDIPANSILREFTGGGCFYR